MHLDSDYAIFMICLVVYKKTDCRRELLANGFVYVEPKVRGLKEKKQTFYVNLVLFLQNPKFISLKTVVVQAALKNRTILLFRG